jgi:hypothetical protein
VVEEPTYNAICDGMMVKDVTAAVPHCALEDVAAVPLTSAAAYSSAHTC